MLDDYGGSLSELARGAPPAAEQVALAQLAAWGSRKLANESKAVSHYDCLSMENCTKVFARASTDDTGGAGMSNDTPFDALWQRMLARG